METRLKTQKAPEGGLCLRSIFVQNYLINQRPTKAFLATEHLRRTPGGPGWQPGSAGRACLKGLSGDGGERQKLIASDWTINTFRPRAALMVPTNLDGKIEKNPATGFTEAGPEGARSE